MGLDVSHGCWRGAYSAFFRWRNELAQVGGYPLTQSLDTPGVMVPAIWHNTHWEPENYMGVWATPPEDPLLLLLIHSDCDGVIPGKLAGFLADRLEALIPLLPIEPALGHIGDWTDKTKAFVEGLRAAHNDHEDVEFW